MRSLACFSVILPAFIASLICLRAVAIRWRRGSLSLARSLSRPDCFLNAAVAALRSVSFNLPSPSLSNRFTMASRDGRLLFLAAVFFASASTLVIPPTSKAAAAITPNVCIFILCLFVSLVLTLLSRIRVIRSISEPPSTAKMLAGLEIFICSNWANVWAINLGLGTAFKDASSQQYSLSIFIWRDNHQTTGWKKSMISTNAWNWLTQWS